MTASTPPPRRSSSAAASGSTPPPSPPSRRDRRDAAQPALLVPLLLRPRALPRPRRGRGEGLPHRARPAARLRPDARGLSRRPRLRLAPAQREIRGVARAVQFPDFMAITCGLVAYLIGEAINNRVPLLRHFNIPDPVTGGLLVAVLLFALHELGTSVSASTPTPRPIAAHLLTGIGLNARISDLVKGGRPLAILVGLTAVLLIVQNLVGGLAAGPPGCRSASASSSAPPRSSAATAPSSPGRPSSPPAASPAAPRSASPWPPSASSAASQRAGVADIPERQHLAGSVAWRHGAQRVG